MAKSYLIGIDEVGRGPLAGPVVVAALVLPVGIKFKNLKDSKKLSAAQREKWFEWIKQQSDLPILYATASVYPKVIDRINISQAANLAATRALRRLLGSRVRGLANRVNVLLDGGLYLNIRPLLATSGYTLYPRTVVKGDEKYNCIKLASIVAKVKRDRIMKRNHLKYPDYGFDAHKGYGTKAHMSAIKKRGPCQLHRLTFLKNYINIKSK